MSYSHKTHVGRIVLLRLRSGLNTTALNYVRSAQSLLEKATNCHNYPASPETFEVRVHPLRRNDSSASAYTEEPLAQKRNV